jgi:hypothetical protein
MKIKPNEYLAKMLKGNRYEVVSIDKLEVKVVIDDYGTTLHIFDMTIALLIVDTQRLEVINIKKTYKEFKKLAKEIHS